MQHRINMGPHDWQRNSSEAAKKERFSSSLSLGSSVWEGGHSTIMNLTSLDHF